MTGPHPDTPVLVGVSARSYRPEDGEVPALLDAMVDAARAAGGDAGCPALLEKVTWIGVPKGAWTHPDPGRVVAAELGASEVHTVLGEVGVLQQAVIDAACRAVQGGAPAALVVGAETAHGSKVGAPGAVVDARAGAAEPDEHLASADFGISGLEINGGLIDPPTVYAVLESAHAAAQGWDAAEHRRRLGDLWARFAAVAATNPAAWRTDAPDADAIVEPGPGNRMVATPYTKLCCSNIQVNQSAALLFTTAARAATLGIGRDRWVLPHGSAVSNRAVPVVARPDLARSPNAAAAGRRALAIAGVGVDDLAHIDLYSCFPAAVQIAAAELGIDVARQLTVTGGMTFAGGPLNSYLLHSTAAMAGLLRADPDATGLVTSVSGFLTKYGAAVWSARPPATTGWRGDDVTAVATTPGDALTEVPRDSGVAEQLRRPRERQRAGWRWGASAASGGAAPREAVDGPLTVVGATVAHDRDGGRRLAAVAETDDGRRTVVSSTDDGLVSRGLAGDLVGQRL